ncbi:MAG: DUF1854 domain-containing protein [bacterium]
MRVIRREGGALELRYGEEVHYPIRVKQAFPLTNPENYIVFLTEQGKQIGMVEDLNKLDKESQRNIREELDIVFFIPQIKKIFWIKERFGGSKWKVETDRGIKEFSTPSLHESIKEVEDGHIIITDTEGLQYEIKNIDELPPKSKKILMGVI